MCPQPGSVKRSGDDGLGQRNGWHYDINGSNTVDSSDPWVWFVHDDRWRQVATFRGNDTNPKERFVHHNAGLDGFGGSSYIDSVILADRNQMNGTTDTPWADAAADGTCETRTYLLQNWRADTSVLMKATSGGGVVLQRIKYSPYGTPERLFGIQDFNKDGFVEFTDFDDFVAAFDNGEPSSDVNQDGFLDFSDFDAFQGAFEDTSITDDGREIRKLWAGTERELSSPMLISIRARMYSTELGIWMSRDPYQYSDSIVSFVIFARNQPISRVDPSGLTSIVVAPPVPATPPVMPSPASPTLPWIPGYIRIPAAIGVGGAIGLCIATAAAGYCVGELISPLLCEPIEPGPNPTPQSKGPSEPPRGDEGGKDDGSDCNQAKKDKKRYCPRKRACSKDMPELGTPGSVSRVRYCRQAAVRRAAGDKCLDARRRITRYCYGGTDNSGRDHQGQEHQVQTAMKGCEKRMQEYCGHGPFN